MLKVFSMVFNDISGNYKAISTVINATVTQKLEKWKKNIPEFFKSLQHFVSNSMFFQAIAKQLASLSKP